jgi:proline-specific peptidase
VLADTAASFPDFVAEANRLRADLPPDVEATLRRHEDAGTTDDTAYAEACQVFYARHVCRLDPWPAELVEAFAWIERDPTVYHTMNGPSEFHVIGSIKDWQSKDRLGSIDVPTLLVSAATTRQPPRCKTCCKAPSTAPSGCCSTSRRTCHTSKNADGTCTSSANGSHATNNRLVLCREPASGASREGSSGSPL